MWIVKLALRIVLGALFVMAGWSHFKHPRPFEAIVPPPLPPQACVFVSGVVEIWGGLAFPFAPHKAGLVLILLLIAVFPANIYMAVKGIKFRGFPPQPWMSWARLPLQPLLIGLIWWAS